MADNNISISREDLTFVKQQAEALILWADKQLLIPGESLPPVPTIPSNVQPMAWGAKVSREFRTRIWWICYDPEMGLGMNHDDLMSCIAWETGRSFEPDKRNLAGSGATGLIQFMPSTARALGTTTDDLARMSAEDQLNYVWKYFEPWKGKLKTLSDLYMAILWPKGVGEPEHYTLWTKTREPVTYRQNSGLDTNKDGTITKAECSAKLYAMKAEGLREGNVA